MKTGDRVKIVAGKYKKNGEGVHLRPAGFISAAIKVKDDKKQERTLRLSSIELMEMEPRTSASATTREELLEDIADLTKRLKELEVKVKQLN